METYRADVGTTVLTGHGTALRQGQAFPVAVRSHHERPDRTLMNVIIRADTMSYSHDYQSTGNRGSPDDSDQYTRTVYFTHGQEDFIYHGTLDYLARIEVYLFMKGSVHDQLSGYQNAKTQMAGLDIQYHLRRTIHCRVLYHEPEVSYAGGGPYPVGCSYPDGCS